MQPDGTVPAAHLTYAFYSGAPFHNALLMPTKGTLPFVESTSRDYFSLAGFEVTIIGRFWVATEVRVGTVDRKAVPQKRRVLSPAAQDSARHASHGSHKRGGHQ